MSDISNLPNSKKIILKTRPDGDPKVSDFEMIEEVAKAPNDGEVLVEVQALEIGAWIRTTLNETAFHGSTPIGGTPPSMGIGKVLGFAIANPIDRRTCGLQTILEWVFERLIKPPKSVSRPKGLATMAI